jgi:dTDP-4-amino-4,6-dideoxygalactose transaminase
MGLPEQDFVQTEELFNRIVLLPLYPTLDGEIVENVVRGIKAIL